MEKRGFFGKAFYLHLSCVTTTNRYTQKREEISTLLSVRIDWIFFTLSLSSFYRVSHKDTSVNWGASNFQVHFISPHNGTMEQRKFIQNWHHCKHTTHHRIRLEMFELMSNLSLVSFNTLLNEHDIYEIFHSFRMSMMG